MVCIVGVVWVALCLPIPLFVCCAAWVFAVGVTHPFFRVFGFGRVAAKGVGFYVALWLLLGVGVLVGAIVAKSQFKLNAVAAVAGVVWDCFVGGNDIIWHH